MSDVQPSVDADEALILAAVADLEGDEPGSLPDTRAAASRLADRARQNEETPPRWIIERLEDAQKSREETNDLLNETRSRLVFRARAAEARVEELEAALLEVGSWHWGPLAAAALSRQGDTP